MLCQKCQERPATVHLTKVVNFEKTELHLCESCAKSAGSELGVMFEPNFSFPSLISALLEGDFNVYQQPTANQEMVCETCGLTFSDFRNQGFLGCGDCYRHFQSGLEPLLKRVQGSTTHTGKVPKRTGGKVRLRKEIDSLRTQLQQAVSREDYEQAAFLRDEIRRREREL